MTARQGPGRRSKGNLEGITGPPSAAGTQPHRGDACIHHAGHRRPQFAGEDSLACDDRTEAGSYCEHMKLSADLEKKFNEQITLEFEASLVYRQLAIEAD